jgi:hypothetical protein
MRNGCIEEKDLKEEEALMLVKIFIFCNLVIE